ncbi:MAG: DNA primase [Lachnospiraceae bacterium]|nr:DNA primase [Lachnospiraceae bacterium]
MYYSDELIEEVRSSNDIVDVISSYVRLQKKGGTYFGLCPFHNEKSPSFSVTPAKQMYYCFGCGQGGNVFTFMMKYENYSFTEAVQNLADRAGITLPVGEFTAAEKAKADLKMQLLQVNNEAAKYFYRLLKSEKGQRAYEYLKNRGLSDETITKFGLGYSSNYKDDLYQYIKSKGYTDEVLKESGLFTFSEKGVYDKFSNRVMFPIMDINNRVIAFGGRVMGDGQPKYLNSPETMLFDKSRNLYGLNVARSSRKDSILICEGYMDVIALHQAGFNNAVASLGTAYTSKHASLLKRYTENVYLTFDSDGAGVKAALRALPILRQAGISAKVINMKPYKDPDEFIKNLGAEEYEKRIENARNSFMFEVDKLREETDENDPDKKAKFQKEVATRLLRFSDALERNVYIDAVSEEFMIPKDSLTKTVNTLALTYDGEKTESTIKQEEVKKEKTPMSAGCEAQKTLLTWLIEEQGVYNQIKSYITKKDFVEEPYAKVAEMLFEQLENGEINPAKIINYFGSEEEQNQVAGLFNANIGADLVREEKIKRLVQAVEKVKANSLDYRSKNETDLKEFLNIQKEKDSFKNVKIKIDL